MEMEDYAAQEPTVVERRGYILLFAAVVLLSPILNTVTRVLNELLFLALIAVAIVLVCFLLLVL